MEFYKFLAAFQNPLRIPAIHGAKTTKNQTPLARLAQ